MAGVADRARESLGRLVPRFWPINEDRFDYSRAMRPLDPIEHVASIAPRPLLLQFADDDYFIAGMDASELYNAAGEPKQIKRYEADHGMRTEQARADRREFILEQLEGALDRAHPLLRASWLSSASPSASISGGMYIPNLPR